MAGDGGRVPDVSEQRAEYLACHRTIGRASQRADDDLRLAGMGACDGV
jgi:hypothetical protein